MCLYVFTACLRALFIRGTGTGCPLFHRDVGRGWCTHTYNFQIPKGVKIDNYTLPNNHKDIKDVKSLKTNNSQNIKSVK